MKTIEPTMMDNVGAIPTSAGNAFIPSLKLILYMTPIIISARPASCKNIHKLVFIINPLSVNTVKSYYAYFLTAFLKSC